MTAQRSESGFVLRIDPCIAANRHSLLHSPNSAERPTVFTAEGSPSDLHCCRSFSSGLMALSVKSRAGISTWLPVLSQRASQAAALSCVLVVACVAGSCIHLNSFLLEAVRWVAVYARRPDTECHSLPLICLPTTVSKLRWR